MPQAQDECDEQAQPLIHRNEKETGENDHQDHEPGRDHGFAAGRPSDLAGFGAHILKKLEWIDHVRKTSRRDLGRTAKKSGAQPKGRTPHVMNS
jgi:hypothetical protein